MRKGLLIALLIAMVTTMMADGKKSLADYCKQIDEAIAHSADYVAAHEKKIGEAKHALNFEASDKGKYQLNFQLYELYKPFVSDSAMYFLGKCIALADKLGDASAAVKCRSLMAIKCANIGMYDEALNILDSIRPVGIDTLTLGVYYDAYSNVYSELAYYTRLDLMKQKYQAKADYYKQLMLKTMPETYETCFLRREQDAQGEGRLEEAMAINDQTAAKGEVVDAEIVDNRKNEKKPDAKPEEKRAAYYARVINDGDAAEELMFNSITPKNFVHLNGVDYSNMGALAEISALGNGTYQPEKAIEYKEAAKKELEEAGVKLPVVILLPYGSGDAWADESQAVESQLEGLLGTDYIDIVVEHSMANSFVSDVRKAGNYAICKTNWGPDYDDPQTFTEPFSDGSFASANKYQFAYKNEGMDEVMAPYYQLVIKAMEIYDDMEARYLAFAEAEAYLIEHAILIPFGFTTGGYTASRIDPFTVPFTACGMSKERYKGVVLLDAPMSTDQYYDALDQWESEVAALAQN